MEQRRQEVWFTQHGWERATARGISKDGVAAALRWGRRYWSRGCRVHRLDRRSVARARHRGDDIHEHEGITAVVSPCGLVVTTYRNRNPRRVRR